MISTNFLEILITFITSLIASSGFWIFLTKKNESKDLSRKLLIGLAHDRIIYLSLRYIERGSITQDEYETLQDFLYCPYSKMGGNGSARRLMTEVEKLPIYNRSLEEQIRSMKDVSK